MATTITSSGTLTLAAGYPKDDAEGLVIRSITKVTVVNSEVLTINHGTETDILRAVRVINTATGEQIREPAAADTNAGVTVIRTDANTTTLTFGSAAAGTYNIVIEYGR